MSLERHDGFRKIAKDLIDKKRELNKTPATTIKRKLMQELEDEIQLYKGMYMTEMDIYTGILPREPRKFLLNDDGFTYTLNKEWKASKEDNI